MVEINIKLSPGDPDYDKNMQAVRNFLGQLAEPEDGAREVASEAPKKEAPKKGPEAKPTPKKEPEAEAPKKDAEPEAGTDTGSDDITIDAVRTILAEKVGDHRQAIKDKLTELEAKNVTTLEQDDYPEFVEFLKQLK